MAEYRKSVIVDSMTTKEILEVFMDDLRFLQHKMEETKKNYKKLIRNSTKKERIYYKPLNFQSARGFHYVIQYFKRSEDEISKSNVKDKLGIIYYAWFLWKKGIHAITFSKMSSAWTNSFWHFKLYTPHFIDRYKERYLKDMSISKPDAFFMFIINNLKMTSTGHPSEKYENSVWEICHDGLCLGRILDKFTYEVKTFVSYEMTGIDQKEFALRGRDSMLSIGFEMNLPDENLEEFTEDVI